MSEPLQIIEGRGRGSFTFDPPLGPEPVDLQIYGDREPPVCYVYRAGEAPPMEWPEGSIVCSFTTEPVSP